MYIIAVDPGEHTGVAEFNTERGPWMVGTSTPLSAVDYLDRLIGRKRQANMAMRILLVAERFTVTTTKHTRQYAALETIGALRFIAWRHGVEFELQSRADKERVSLAVARRLAATAPDNRVDDHGLDAVRHGVIALATNGFSAYVREVERAAG